MCWRRQLYAWSPSCVRSVTAALLLDLDTIVLGSLDELFRFPPDVDFRAAAESGEGCRSELLQFCRRKAQGGRHINSAVMALKPSMASFKAMVNYSQRRGASYRMGDQNFFDEYFGRAWNSPNSTTGERPAKLQRRFNTCVGQRVKLH